MALLRRSGVVLLLAVTLILIADGPARADVCRKRKGILLLRPGDCRKKETQVDSATLPLAGDRGDKGPTGDPGPAGTGPRLHVVDSAGHDVGVVVAGSSSDGTASVLRQIGSDSFVLRGVNRTGFVHDESLLRYASADCAKPATSVLIGDSYLCQCSPSRIAVPGLALPLFIDEERTTGYRPVDEAGVGIYARQARSGATADAASQACGAAPGTVIGSSAPCAFDTSQVCVPCCVHDLNPFNVLQAVQPVDVGSLGLVPPFAFRTQTE